jgi:vacuolar-type H+-ATPase catalytic subunit A/Vma1
VATGETHANYLRDLGGLLRQRAEETAREARAIRAKRRVEERTSEDAFAAGLNHAYYEVISLMQQQADAFGLALADLELEGLDPERDLT